MASTTDPPQHLTVYIEPQEGKLRLSGPRDSRNETRGTG